VTRYLLAMSDRRRRRGGLSTEQYNNARWSVGASSLGDQPEAESPDGLARRQIRQDEEEPDKTGRCDTFHLAALIMHKRVTRCSQKVSSNVQR